MGWGWLAGAPHYVRDLSGVAAGQAKTIVILNPEEAVVSISQLRVTYCVHNVSSLSNASHDTAHLGTNSV